MSEENVELNRARESHFFLYKLQWCEGEQKKWPTILFFYRLVFSRVGYSISVLSLRRAF